VIESGNLGLEGDLMKSSKIVATIFLISAALVVAYLSFKYAWPARLDLRVPPPPSPLQGKGKDLIAA
jgi:hypothetical protein